MFYFTCFKRSSDLSKLINNFNNYQRDPFQLYAEIFLCKVDASLFHFFSFTRMKVNAKPRTYVHQVPLALTHVKLQFRKVLDIINNFTRVAWNGI